MYLKEWRWMTFKKKTMEFLNKMLCGFVTLYRDKVVPLRFQVVGVYTNDLSKSSQRARSFFFFFFFWFAKYFAHDEHAFIGQSEMFFLRILPEVSDPWCWPKGSQPLRTRLGAVCNWVKWAFVLGHFSIPENNSKEFLQQINCATGPFHSWNWNWKFPFLTH